MSELSGSGKLDLSYLEAVSRNLPDIKDLRREEALTKLQSIASKIGYDVTQSEEGTVTITEVPANAPEENEETPE